MPGRYLHVVRSLDPSAGGLPAVVRQLTGELAARGHAVAVVADDVPAGAAPPAGVTVTALPPGRAGLAGRVAAADVVHLHGVWDRVLYRAAAAARRAGVPYVVTPHGMLDRWCLAQKKWKKRVALALGYRAMLDRAAVLHLLNRDEAAALEPLGLTAPTRVVPNGLDLAAVDPLPPAAEFRAAWPAVGDAPFVLFLSRLHPKKGLDILADALARLAPARPDVRLVVAGPDGGARVDFERRVAAAGLADRVVLTGPLYGRAKWAALAAASVFCLPSRQEGFSVAILEALAARVPVVVSAECHFPEVSEAGAGEVVPLDAGAVAAALGRVLDTPGDRGLSGRKLVEERYTTARVGDLLEQLYADTTRGTG